jgi:hypothetical protein
MDCTRATTPRSVGIDIFAAAAPRHLAHEQTGPVIRGYLALLLARALLSHPDGSERVRQRWECDNQEEVSGELVRALEALQALHRQAGQAGQPSDEEDEGDSDRIVSDTLEELRAV